MLLGTDVHAEVETYLRGKGVPLASKLAGRIALPGLRWLPEPGTIPDADIECEVNLYLSEAPLHVPVICRIDLRERALRRATDHKTTSNVKYMKEPAELETDPQAVCYSGSMWIEDGQPDVPYAFRHVYYLTRGAPKSPQPPIATLTPEHMQREMLSLAADMREMEQQALEPVAAKIPANLSACGDYGGCPHMARCASVGTNSMGPLSALLRPRTTDTQAEKTKENPMTTQSSLAASIAARRAQQQAAKSTAPAAPETPAAAPAPAAAAAAPSPAPAPAAAAAPAPAPEPPAQPAAADLRKDALATTTDAAASAPVIPEGDPLTPPQRPTPEALDKMKQMGTQPGAFVPEHKLNPPDGTPANEVGKLEEQKKPKAKVLTAPDGRALTSLDKDALTRLHRGLTGKLDELGRMDAYADADKGVTVVREWFNSDVYLTKSPCKRTDIRDDVELLLSLLDGEDLTDIDAGASTGPGDDVELDEGELQALVDVDPELLAHAEKLGKLKERADAAKQAEESTAAAVESTRKTFKGAEPAEEAAAEQAWNKAKTDHQSAVDESATAYKEFAAATADGEAVRLAAVERATAKLKAEKVAAAKKAAAPAGAKAAPTQRKAPSGGTGLVPLLFINCHPDVTDVLGAVTYAETWLEPIQSEVAAAHGVGHFLLIGFNDGKKGVAVRVGHLVKGGELALPPVLVALRSVMGDPVIDELVRLYKAAGGLAVWGA
uniref:Uncharacterized protein n=1 Tax=uncultured Caudovirales phage TaxID=2100421 RepID=A0A6J5LAM0_9CAUD|nr:hypothetical protein UFOVP114_95 [uncultured Caudovirales phage]